MTARNLIIGIDTGGTYTDAVVIDAGPHAILGTAKALTTKGNLAIGVAEAMALAAGATPGFDPIDVSMVSVSTTLATNAIVEGHGTQVGLVLIGFDEQMEARSGLKAAFPGMPILRVGGGHDHAGAEIVALDTAAIEVWLKAVGSDVSAFAIAASFATRNPAHELGAAALVAQACAKPVTLSHQLANSLDAPRRAQTAVLNARLVARIGDLVVAVRAAMEQMKIDCPLMLVKGDGSLADAQAMAQRPIETVLSGPAASVIGAQWLSGLSDFILSDMGGTTTDVAVLQAGQPRIAEQGAEVGRWRTMVKAIDVRTIGLGGDSEVHVQSKGELHLGPERAVPLALLAHRYPHTLTMLENDLAETAGGSLLGRFLVLPFGTVNQWQATGLNATESQVMAALASGPVSLRSFSTGGAGPRTIASLRKRGLVQLSAFTPSDAAHVLGLQDNWSAQAARLGARLMARFRNMKVADEAAAKSLARDVWEEAVAATGHVILRQAFDLPLEGPLVEAVVRGRPRLNLVDVGLTPAVPIVAVGGPVKIYYAEVAHRLGCEVVFAPHYDVANAVGAAAGLVAARASVEVEGDGAGVFRVTGQGSVLTFTSGVEALARACALAQNAAFALAEMQGAKDITVKVSVTKSLLPGASDDEGLLSALIVGEGRGKPFAA